MKKTLKIGLAVLSLSTVTSLAFAALPGTYVGGGLGYSRLNTFDHDIVTGQGSSLFSQSRDRGGLGERVFAGYNFNEYFGIEGGYAHYAKSSYDASSKSLGMSASSDFYLQDINLVAKGYLPVYEGVNLYALGGAAYVFSKTDYSTSGATVPGYPASGSFKTNRLRPTYGVGATYDIPQTQLTAGVEWSRVQGSGNTYSNDHAIPSADMVSFNLAYNLG